ncbi:MAG: aldo/keto reductase [Pirellulales bacterium]|nr:aldo/keto reductase [Pirellulales bacterium]
MRMPRRIFLGSAVASTAGGFVTNQAAAEPAKIDSTALDPTALVPLGKILKVSRIGFGTGMKAYFRQSNHTRLGQKHLDRLFHYAYDQGIRLFDLADLYGSHSHAARCLGGKPRESYVLVSKIWDRRSGIPDADKGDADVVVKRFLKELKTDYLDLVQFHCMSGPNWAKKHRRQMDLLAKLKEKGLIRAHGCSCHSLGALETAAKEPWVDVIHARLNPFQLNMDQPPERTLPVLKKARAAGKGVIGMKIIGEGTLRNDDQKRERSVHFALASGGVDAIIIGFEQTWEMDDIKARVTRALAAMAKKDQKKEG